MTEKDLRAPYQAVVDHAVGLLVKYKNAYNRLVHNIHSLSGFAFGPMLLWVLRKNMGRFRDRLEELESVVKQIVRHSTPVVSLMHASLEWTRQVQKPANQLTEQLTSGSINMALWKDDVSEIYRTVALKEQSEALKELAGSAVFIGDWLFSAAEASVKAMLDFAQRLAELLKTLTAVVTTALTVVGLAKAAGQLGDLCGDLVKTYVDILSKFAEKLVHHLSHERDLEKFEADHPKLGDGRWPQSVKG